MIYHEPFDPEIAKREFSILVGMIQDDEKKVRFWLGCLFAAMADSDRS